MKPGSTLSTIFIFVSIAFFTACNSQDESTDTKEDQSSSTPAIVEQNVDYVADGKTFKGYITYDSNNREKRPAVLIVHEWWGLTEYPRERAKQLAELGYIAMAVDVFGDGKTADNPDSAMKLAMPFYNDPSLGKTRLDYARAKLIENPNVDTGKIAAIGYCFGGNVVLNSAKLGSNLKGVVSFHGGLAGPSPSKESLKADILVCHGEADSLVSNQEITTFRKGLDSIGHPYTWKGYPNAKHAFTNPAATETGKKFNLPVEYNAEADKNSWEDMKAFLSKIFPK